MDVVQFGQQIQVHEILLTEQIGTLSLAVDVGRLRVGESAN